MESNSVRSILEPLLSFVTVVIVSYWLGLFYDRLKHRFTLLKIQQVDHENTTVRYIYVKNGLGQRKIFRDTYYFEKGEWTSFMDISTYPKEVTDRITLNLNAILSRQSVMKYGKTVYDPKIAPVEHVKEGNVIFVNFKKEMK